MRAALVAALVVLAGCGGSDVEIKRGAGDAFPLRGSLADDPKAIEAAIDAADLDEGLRAQVVYAGRAPGGDLVLFARGRTLLAMRRGAKEWKLEEVRENFRWRQGEPVRIAGALLLPVGDWTVRPIDGSPAPAAADGLVASPTAALAITEGRVFASPGLTFQVSDADERTARTAPPRAVHGALVASRESISGFDLTDQPLVLQRLVLRRVGGRQAAIALTIAPLGAGIGTDDARFGLDSIDGPRTALTGAAYVGDRLAAVGADTVAEFEFRGPHSTFRRPGPIAVVDVPWNPREYRGEVVGFDASGRQVGGAEPKLPGD